MNPPRIANEAAFHRNNVVIVSVASGLAGAGLLGVGIFVGGIGALLNGRHYGREFSYYFLFGLGGIAFLSFLGGHTIQHWSDVKEGFLEGFRAGRGTF